MLVIQGNFSNTPKGTETIFMTGMLKIVKRIKSKHGENNIFMVKTKKPKKREPDKDFIGSYNRDSVCY